MKYSINKYSTKKLKKFMYILTLYDTRVNIVSGIIPDRIKVYERKYYYGKERYRLE